MVRSEVRWAYGRMRLELQGVLGTEGSWNRSWSASKRADPALLRELLGARLELLEEVVGEAVVV